MQLKALGFVRGRWSFVEFLEFFAVNIVAHCVVKSGQELVAHSCSVLLALEGAINKPQLLLSATLGVVAVLGASRTHLNSELQTFSIVLEIQLRAEVKSQDVDFDQHFTC